jgi:carboxymethylenebutenolidase
MNNNNRKKKNRRHPNLGAIFDKHLKCEFEEHDVDATMKTMVKEPYVHHIPTLTGGIGYVGVYNFYKSDFVGKMPDDTKVLCESRTVGKDQVVDELILSFTHDREIKFMLPGIPPTGKYVELPHIVVMKFNGNKIARTCHLNTRNLLFSSQVIIKISETDMPAFAFLFVDRTLD